MSYRTTTAARQEPIGIASVEMRREGGKTAGVEQSATSSDVARACAQRHADRLFREPGFPVGHVVDFINTPWMMPAICNVARIFIVSM